MPSIVNIYPILHEDRPKIGRQTALELANCLATPALPAVDAAAAAAAAARTRLKFHVTIDLAPLVISELLVAPVVSRRHVRILKHLRIENREVRHHHDLGDERCGWHWPVRDQQIAMRAAQRRED